MDPEEVSSKLIELEDRSRRNNLRIDGIKEKPKETWEECEENVQEMIKENLGITEPTETDRCHRISKRKKPNRPRTVICRITKFKDKQKILKNAKYLKRFRNLRLRRFLQGDDGASKNIVGSSSGISKTE